MKNCPRDTCSRERASKKPQKCNLPTLEDLEDIFDSEDVSPLQKEDILKQIRTRIECDIRLLLLDARQKPTKSTYYECMTLLNYMKKYGMNTERVREEIDIAFPLSFLREKELSIFRESIQRLREYSENSSGLEHTLIFEQGYRGAVQSISRLSALGSPIVESEKELDNVLKNTFLPLYLRDAITLALWFLEGRSELRLVVSANQVTAWKADFNEALSLYAGYVGNGSNEYKDIVQKYKNILPKMLEREKQIDLTELEGVDTPTKDSPR